MMRRTPMKRTGFKTVAELRGAARQILADETNTLVFKLLASRYSATPETEQEREQRLMDKAQRAMNSAVPRAATMGLGTTAAAPIPKAARMAAKVERASIKARKEALKTIAELIADAQVAFNAFIRERDKHKGCFVCGRPFTDKPGQVQHAGHVRSRGAAGHLRFHEDNCMGECEGCNGPYGAKPHQIKAGAIARIGQERFDALENDNTHHKWTREELIAIRDTYRAKLKELKHEARQH